MIAILTIDNTSEAGTNIITVCPNYDGGCQCPDEYEPDTEPGNQAGNAPVLLPKPHRVDRYGAEPPHVLNKDGEPTGKPDRSAEQWAHDCAIESLRIVHAERTALTKPDTSAPASPALSLAHLDGLTLS